ncbi:MAG: DUF1254 domain-containing protein [Alphaproteobacteria bacterium]
MMSLLRWTVFTLLLAAAIHVSAVHFLPISIVSTAHSRIVAISGANTMTHGPRVDETARQVVRPSPDLLYSICAFDLSDGPVRITAPVPEGTYTSLSLYDLDSTNFFAQNDRTVPFGRFDLTLLPPASGSSSTADAAEVVAPRSKGIVLFRTLITDETAFGRLDAARRQATCAPVSDGGRGAG